MAMHDGHRQRMKDRYRQDGLDHFNEVQVLELLLFYCIPRQDTNPLAHRLVEQFGSLSQVLEAPMSALAQVPGMGENAATFLHLVRDAGRAYQINRVQQEKILQTTEQCGRYLSSYFIGRRNEMVFLLCLDAKCKVLDCREVSEGSVNSAGVSTRRVVEIALAANATTVVLAHNHPSGIAVPSREDVQTTYRVEAALDAVDVVLADHIIVSDGDYTSMVQSGLFKPGAMAHR